MSSPYRDKRSLPLFDSPRIASPCDVRWGDMFGDEQVRWCWSCQKKVYNLSAMSSEATEALLQERVEGLSLHFYRRADGTILTADCPIGSKRRKRIALAMAGVGAMTVVAVSATMPSPYPTMTVVTVAAPKATVPAPTETAKDFGASSEPIAEQSSTDYGPGFPSPPNYGVENGIDVIRARGGRVPQGK